MSAKATKKSTPTLSRGPSQFIAGLLIFASAFLVYANSLSNQYALDDEIVIRKNQFTRQGFAGISSHLSEEAFTGFFRRRTALVEGGRYRPLSFITFCIEEQLFNTPEALADQDSPYDKVSNPSLAPIRHFVNVSLFAATAWLLFTIMSMLLGKSDRNILFQAPFIGSLLFALHPIHTEVVANIKGRDEIMVLFFCLLSLRLALLIARPGPESPQNNMGWVRIGGLFLTFFLALLSKENALTFIVILPLTLWWFTSAQIMDYVKVMGPVILAFCLYLTLRIPAVAPPDEKMPDLPCEILNDPWCGVSFADRAGTVGVTMGHYFQLLIAPVNLTNDYYPWQIAITPLSSLSSLLPWIGAIAIGLYGLWGIRKKDPLGYFILFFFLTFFVVSNLVVSIGTLMGERFLFISSVGFCMAVAILIERLGHKLGAQQGRNAVIACMAIPAIAFTILTVMRNPAWENDYTLFTTDVYTSSGSSKAQTSAAGQWQERAEKPETSPEEKKALLDTALVHVNEALRIYPFNHNALLIKGNILYTQGGKNDSALAAYEKVLDRFPNNTDALRNLAIVGNQSGNPRRAVSYYLRYLKAVPKDAVMWHDLGLAYSKRNMIDSAIFYMQKSVEAQPAYGAGWSELGTLHGKHKGDFAQAIACFEKAVQAGYTAAGVWIDYGVCVASLRGPLEAIKIWERGLGVNPGSRELISNISKAYYNLGDTQNAQIWASKIGEPLPAGPPR